MIQEGMKAFNRPGHGTSFGKKAFPKGTFKARTSKKDLFSIFSLPIRAVAKSLRRKVAFTRPEGHTVARIQSSFSSPVAASQNGPLVENIWKSCGMCRLTGFYPARMFVGFRGQSVSL
jgi:hypothetical protein